MTATSNGAGITAATGSVRARTTGLLSRALRVPAPTTAFTVDRRVRIPMRDGVELLADHYAPDTATPAGTLLVRCPYGRAFPFSSLYARVYAARGYHVLLQSVRGTFGSGGAFEPPVNEASDGADTAAWLREQNWYTGSFGTIGLSYLGQTQWALMQDPPADMKAAVVVVGVHDFAASTWGTGAFAANDFLGWSHMVSHQEDPNRLRMALRQLRSRRQIARAVGLPPLAASGRALLAAGAPWWERWIENPDIEHPFWEQYRFYGGLDRAEVPVLLMGGWQDLFLEQTLEQYHRLHRRGVDVQLTLGPWTHTHMTGRAAATVLRESLDWLGRHLGGAPTPDRAPVRYFVTGGGGWRDAQQWPPADTTPRVLHLAPVGLTEQAPTAGSRSFTFDPLRPTPTVGGRLLAPGAGRRRDDRLAQRPDVLSFTSQPLADDLWVYGAPVVELDHESDNPHVDLFVRVSEVDRKGRSRNISDGYRRLVRTECAGPVVRVELDEIAHRFAAGTRIRVLVAGGSFPRFAPNLGTGEHPAHGRRTAPATHTVALRGASRLLLPEGPAQPSAQN
jgi:uncharacterized protein